MRTKVLAIVATSAVALYWAQTTHGQVQSVPGPGTGIVTVQGVVDIRKMPMLDVGQRGDWRVTLASVADTRVLNMPPVMLSRPSFVRGGARYAITWPSGEQETIRGRASGRRCLGARDRQRPRPLAEPVARTGN